MEDQEKPNRLNFGHGFYRDIVKNQIERDEYEKELAKRKQAQETLPSAVQNGVSEESSSTVAPRLVAARLKRPERAHYVPPNRKNLQTPTTTQEDVQENSEALDQQEKFRERARRKIAKELDEKPVVTSPPSAPLASPQAIAPSSDAKRYEAIFKLELKDVHGDVHVCVVHRGQHPSRVAKAFAQRLQLPDEAVAALRQRIAAELQARGVPID